MKVCLGINVMENKLKKRLNKAKHLFFDKISKREK